MKKLLDIEIIKTLGYPAFKAVIGIHAVLFLIVAVFASGINIDFQGITLDKLFQFPHVWSMFAWISSWFNLLLGIVAIILITNELQFRTFRKHLIDGLTRNELLYGKLMVFFFVALYTMLLVFVTGLIIGAVKSTSFSFVDFVDGLPILPVLFFQSLAYMLLAMLFAFIFRGTALSIVSFILFFFPVEPMVRWFFPAPADQFFPIKIISNLTPMPDFFGITLGDVIKIQGGTSADAYSMGIMDKPLPLIATVAIAVGYSLIFILVSQFIVKRRNF